MEVTAHVHSCFFSLQHSSREQKTHNRIVFAGVNYELVPHFILSSSLRGVVLHAAVQNCQNIPSFNLVRIRVYLLKYMSP